ncbi:MAG: hypothetical protein I8H75_01090 [Myxococcaceae bacterium]|nr:hypothetical protein [Myxococcaceae bacterium]MBH2005936.1 hypothetical protein [Myxococcaceae bacterium]
MISSFLIEFFTLSSQWNHSILLCALSILGILTLITTAVSLRNAQFQSFEPYFLLGLAQLLLFKLCQASDLLSFTCMGSVLNIAWIGLTYFRNHGKRVAEIAIKLSFLSLSQFCFLSFILAWATQHGYSLQFSELTKQSDGFLEISLLMAALFWIGASPFVLRFVDTLDGAPSFASIHFFAGSLISGGPLLQVLCANKTDPRLTIPLTAFGFASLILPAFAALDQTRIDRLVSFLLTTQSGILILTALHAPHMLPIFYLQIAFSVPGAIMGLHFWKHRRQSDKNWEDLAGAGQKHPWISFAWLSILSSIGGLPFTVGFSFYEAFTQKALAESKIWFIALSIAAIVLAMTPIARLAAFMFCKPTRHELIKHHQPRQTALIVFCSVALLLTKAFTLMLLREPSFLFRLGNG